MHTIRCRSEKICLVRRTLRVLAALAVIGGVAPAAPAQVPGGKRPDVQVIVMPHPSGNWAVSVVYPGVVGRPVMEAHRKRLMGLSGWKGHGVEYETRGLQQNDGDFSRVKPGQSLNYKNLKPGKDAPAMSSVTFLTSSPIVDWKNATLPVEPFARAFRDLDRVYVMFFVPGEFPFRGLRRHSDDNLDVALTVGKGAYFYALNIKNHKMKALNLPRFQVEQPAADVRTARARTDGRAAAPRLVGISLVVLLAVAAGLLVYWGTHRWAGR